MQREKEMRPEAGIHEAHKQFGCGNIRRNLISGLCFGQTPRQIVSALAKAAAFVSVMYAVLFAVANLIKAVNGL